MWGTPNKNPKLGLNSGDVAADRTSQQGERSWDSDTIPGLWPVLNTCNVANTMQTPQ